MTHFRLLACSLVLAACSSKSNPATTTDSGVHPEGGNTNPGCVALAACCHELPAAEDPTECLTDVQVGTASACSESLSMYQSAGYCKPDGGVGGDAGGGMTIAKARKGNVTTAITVKAFVTALSGTPGDYPDWYIEDPAGGPYSGVLVYCDPDVGTPPCTVTEPALHDLIEVTGSLSTYKGQVELEPTKMTLIQHNATFPPIMALTAADIAPTANSPYRGVFVGLAISPQLVVDSVTPPALADTACGAVLDGGVGDAGPPACTNKCAPPLYAGFQANDGTGNEVYIDAPFFYTDPLQSSPECLTPPSSDAGPGLVPVTLGMQFSKMQGVLDVDPYSMMQDLSPVLPSDYTIAH
jgi:hypothetical protein